MLFSYNLKLIVSKTKSKPGTLPPGPRSIPLVTPILFLNKTSLDIERTLKKLRTLYGPILTLNIASRKSIFISDHKLAHQALIHHGSIFSDRLPPSESNRILSSNKHNVSTSSYGPLWRALRRNLTSEILHPSRAKHFSGARKWVLGILLDSIREQQKSQGAVVVIESFQFAIFCLLVLMCFGQKLDVDEVREIQRVQTRLHKNISKFGVFAFLPRVTKLVYWKRWKLLLDIRREQEKLFVPLIRARKAGRGKEYVCSYTDSLHELVVPEDGGRKLREDEVVSLCSEFMAGGTDTTATALEWIMAELVVHQEVQRRLFEEVRGLLEEEEDTSKMVYLKGVVMEGLRRHPPGHFVIPHVVTEEVEIGGYVVPKDAAVNFMVAEMGWDERVWEKPMEFRPERFVEGDGVGVDITGSREIKMMPFGVGRRICPGLGLAMLHLEYFVACLVREFEWKELEGEKVDFTETTELTIVMKSHLRARVVSRGRDAAVDGVTSHVCE